MTFANTLFNAWHDYNRFLIDLGELVDDFVDWDEYDDLTVDWYDYSFELKDCTDKVILSQKALDKFKELGFKNWWVCYKDGSEVHYYVDSCGDVRWSINPAPLTKEWLLEGENLQDNLDFSAGGKFTEIFGPQHMVNRDENTDNI